MRSSHAELSARLTKLNENMKTREQKPNTGKIQANLQKCADLLYHTTPRTEEALISDKENESKILEANKNAFFKSQTFISSCELLVNCYTHRIEEADLAKTRAEEIAQDQARRDAAEKTRQENERAETKRLREAEERARLETANANAEARRISQERIRQENERAKADEETRKQLELQKAAEKAAFLAKITTGIASLKAEYVQHDGSKSKSEVQFTLAGVNTKDVEAMTAALLAIVKRLRDAGPNGASSKTLPNAEKLAGELGIALPDRAAVTPQGKNASSFLPWKKSKPVETAAAAQSSLASTPTP